MTTTKHPKEFNLRRRASCNKYEKTKAGFLMRVYRNMLSRVTGIQKLKAHLYLGLAIMPKAAFYAWSNSNPNFHKLFDAWEASRFERKLTPSVDRVDSKGGYEVHNIRWLTHSENSSLASRAKWKK